MAITLDGTSGLIVSGNTNTLSGITVGRGAGSVATNTAVGASALASNSTGPNLTAVGSGALYSNTGGYNTAVGVNAMYATTTGTGNSAFGSADASGLAALRNNTTGSNNSAFGSGALGNNTTANNNTAVGYQAGYSNTVGVGNVFTGYVAGYNVTGNYNVAVGRFALGDAGTKSADYNTAVGNAAGALLTTGANNTFIGQAAGYSVTSGGKNTILGCYTGNQGGLDIRTSSNNIVLSDGDGTPRAWCQAGTSGWKFSDNGSRDDNGQQNEFYQSNNVRGLNVRCSNASLTTDGIIFSVADRNTTNNTFYAYGYYNVGAGAYKFRVADSGNVTNTNNSYGAISDIKLKENIVDATPKLAALQNVRIVNYNRIGSEEKELGVIAQELEQVFPALVETHIDRDREGNDLGTVTKSVKYSVFVPMLIKAIQELKAEIDQLKGQA